MIQKTIKKLIQTYQTRDPFQLVLACNIKLLYADLGHVGGFYQYYKRSKLITINQNLNEQQQREVCAHELGHALLHPKQNKFFLHQNTYQNSNKLEREANLFAACLLIDENDTREFLQQGATIDYISSVTGVTPPLVEERIRMFLKENAKNELQTECR